MLGALPRTPAGKVSALPAKMLGPQPQRYKFGTFGRWGAAAAEGEMAI